MSRHYPAFGNITRRESLDRNAISSGCFHCGSSGGVFSPGLQRNRPLRAPTSQSESNDIRHGYIAT